LSECYCGVDHAAEDAAREVREESREEIESLRAQVESQAREIERLTAERDANRRSHLAAEKDCSRALRRVERLEGRLARVLRYAHGYFGHMGTGVWSRHRSGG
jgi:outer membrane murein-binding lipoprotein Lpp